MPPPRIDLIVGDFSPNLCLDVRDGVDADRTVVQQWIVRYTGPSNEYGTSPPLFQTFTIDWFLRSGHGVWTLPGALEPGAPIEIFRCTEDNTNTAQIWETRAITVTQ